MAVWLVVGMANVIVQVVLFIMGACFGVHVTVYFMANVLPAWDSGSRDVEKILVDAVETSCDRRKSSYTGFWVFFFKRSARVGCISALVLVLPFVLWLIGG